MATLRLSPMTIQEHRLLSMNTPESQNAANTSAPAPESHSLVENRTGAQNEATTLTQHANRELTNAARNVLDAAKTVDSVSSSGGTREHGNQIRALWNAPSTRKPEEYRTVQEFSGTFSPSPEAKADEHTLRQNTGELPKNDPGRMAGYTSNSYLGKTGDWLKNAGKSVVRWQYLTFNPPSPEEKREIDSERRHQGKAPLLNLFKGDQPQKLTAEELLAFRDRRNQQENDAAFARQSAQRIAKEKQEAEAKIAREKKAQEDRAQRSHDFWAKIEQENAERAKTRTKEQEAQAAKDKAQKQAKEWKETQARIQHEIDKGNPPVPVVRQEKQRQPVPPRVAEAPRDQTRSSRPLAAAPIRLPEQPPTKVAETPPPKTAEKEQRTFRNLLTP